MSHADGTHGTEVCLWHAIRTRARAEQVVADRLAGANVEPFLPRYLEPVQWSDRLTRTWRPLFAGYVFARFDPSTDAERVTRTSGVVQILSEAIPDVQIESLRIACQASPTLTQTTYRPGELIRITSGPFAGCEGLIDRAQPGKLTLKIDLLKRAVSVTIDRKTAIERVRSNESGR